MVDEIIAYARRENITKIVIGKPDIPRWRERLFGSVVDDLIRQSGQIDVYVIRHEGGGGEKRAIVPLPRFTQRHWAGYFWAVAVTVINTALGFLLYHRFGISNANIAMLYLLGVLLIASRFSRSAAALASVLGVIAFDLSVVPPFGSLAVSDSQYLITLVVMLVTALLISTLTDLIRRQAVSARSREAQTSSLLRLSRELAATREREALVEAVVRHVSGVFGDPAVVMVPVHMNDTTLVPAGRQDVRLDEKEMSVAQWVFEHGQMAGSGTMTLPAARGLYVPLTATEKTVGVLGLLSPHGMEDPERMHLLEAFASQSAIAVERAVLAEESRKAWERVEAEFLRNTLLSGVSHDLRTPLAGITGAATSLLETDKLSDADRKELAENIVNESDRMERLVNNLLDMTRLEAGGFQLKKEWHAVDELIGSSINAMRKRLSGHPVNTNCSPSLPLVMVDGMAIEQVIINILDNAVAYTPPGTPITISAQMIGERVVLQINDTGPGLPEENPQRVFEKFFRGEVRERQDRVSGGSRRGAGLGLAICKGIVELHGGTIWAANRPVSQGGGALFRIELPVGGTPPSPPEEGVELQ